MMDSFDVEMEMNPGKSGRTIFRGGMIR